MTLVRCLMFCFFSLCIVNDAYASEYCPKTVDIINGKYTPPVGWHLTYHAITKSGVKSGTLLFYIVTVNYDHQIGTNNNRISCYYKNPDDNLKLEITTDKSGYAQPKGGYWQALGGDAVYCFPSKSVDPSDCPWN
ncbi:MAG: hypothetical protein ACYCQI_02860 [Gammaproteobacteria bacterium]